MGKCGCKRECKCEKRCGCEREFENPPQCENQVVIMNLPYMISEPGKYCLGQDFVLDGTQTSASIQINSDDVELDFHTRRITMINASPFPVISATNSDNLILRNVKIESTGTAVNASYGIRLSGVSNLTLVDTSLNNLGSANTGNLLTDNFGLYIENSTNLDITKLNILNSNGTGSSVLIYNSVNVQYDRNQVINGRTRFVSSRNVHIDRMQVDNTGSGVGSRNRALQIDSAFNASLRPVAFSENVQIENSEFLSDANGFGIVLLGLRAAQTQGPFDYRVKNVTIKDNAIRAGNGITVQYIQGYTIYHNQLDIIGGNGIAVDGADIGGVIDNNMVSGENGRYGIVVYQSPIPANVTSYNTVKNNQVANFEVGYADNNLIEVGPASVATCTVFKDNVGHGNIANFVFLAPTTVSVDNIFVC